MLNICSTTYSGHDIKDVLICLRAKYFSILQIHLINNDNDLVMITISYDLSGRNCFTKPKLLVDLWFRTVHTIFTFSMTLLTCRTNGTKKLYQ